MIDENKEYRTNIEKMDYDTFSIINKLKKNIDNNSTKIVICIYVNSNTSLFNVSKLCSLFFKKIKEEITYTLEIKFDTKSSKYIQKDNFKYTIFIE